MIIDWIKVEVSDWVGVMAHKSMISSTTLISLSLYLSLIWFSNYSLYLLYLCTGLKSTGLASTFGLRITSFSASSAFSAAPKLLSMSLSSGSPSISTAATYCFFFGLGDFLLAILIFFEIYSPSWAIIFSLSFSSSSSSAVKFEMPDTKEALLKLPTYSSWCGVGTMSILSFLN